MHLKYLSRLLRIVPGDSKAIEAYKADLIKQGKVINADLLIEKAERLK